MRQLVGVRGLEFGKRSIVEHRARQIVRLRELLEHILGSRGLSGGRLAQHRQLQLLKQYLLQLLGRLDVEGRASLRLRLREQPRKLSGNIAALFLEKLRDPPAPRGAPCRAARARAAARSLHTGSAGLARL
jgi:hypothetical protein